MCCANLVVTFFPWLVFKSKLWKPLLIFKKKEVFLSIQPKRIMIFFNDILMNATKSKAVFESSLGLKLFRVNPPWSTDLLQVNWVKLNNISYGCKSSTKLRCLLNKCFCYVNHYVLCTTWFGACLAPTCILKWKSVENNYIWNYLSSFLQQQLCVISY